MRRGRPGAGLLLIALIGAGGCVTTKSAGPAAEVKATAAEFGALGADQKWSHYRPYLKKMIVRIQTQWERLLLERQVYPEAGTKVKVGFRISAAGAITEMVAVEGTAGFPAERACADAIASMAPYGRWTDEMKAVLGETQEMTFTFHYQ